MPNPRRHVAGGGAAQGQDAHVLNAIRYVDDVLGQRTRKWGLHRQSRGPFLLDRHDRALRESSGGERGTGRDYGKNLGKKLHWIRSYRWAVLMTWSGCTTATV